jgi:hypothetical protein
MSYHLFVNITKQFTTKFFIGIFIEVFCVCKVPILADHQTSPPRDRQTSLKCRPFHFKERYQPWMIVCGTSDW